MTCHLQILPSTLKNAFCSSMKHCPVERYLFTAWLEYHDLRLLSLPMSWRPGAWISSKPLIMSNLADLLFVQMKGFWTSLDIINHSQIAHSSYMCRLLWFYLTINLDTVIMLSFILTTWACLEYFYKILGKKSLSECYHNCSSYFKVTSLHSTMTIALDNDKWNFCKSYNP